MIPSKFHGSDKFDSLIAKTGRQVEAHLDDHLPKLPQADARSKTILEQLSEDEAHRVARPARAGQAAQWPHLKSR